MKHFEALVTLLAAFCLCATANAQTVKLRNPNPKPRAVDERAIPETQASLPDQDVQDRDEFESEDEESPVEETGDSSATPNQDVEPDATQPEEQEDASASQSPAALGVLIAPPESPRDLPPREARDVVPDAMRMTLEELVPTKLLRDPRVLRALARTPRVEFVPKKRRELAYLNTEVPLESGRALETPFNDAFLCEAIAPKPEDKVLVVEPGAGFCAAVLTELVDDVYLVGIDKNLTRAAVPTIKELKYSNLYVRFGELESGWQECAPFDKIVIVGGVKEIPEELIAQLKDGGRLVAPIGDALSQTITLCEKSGENVERRPLLTVSLDMLEQPVKPKGTANIELVTGDFETVTPEPYEDESAATTLEPRGTASVIKFAPRRATPVGWCDGRLFEVVEGDAFEGARACLFDNATVREEQIKKAEKAARLEAATLPEDRKSFTEYGQTIKERQLETERASQLRQKLSLDGAVVKKAIFSGAYRVEALDSSGQGITLARVVFYDKDRRELETRDVLKSVSTTPNWREFHEEIQVPFRAKSADLLIGALDGVGVVRFDALQIRNKADRSSSPRR